MIFLLVTKKLASYFAPFLHFKRDSRLKNRDNHGYRKYIVFDNILLTRPFGNQVCARASKSVECSNK